MASRNLPTQNPASHEKLRKQSRLIELLHQREEARLKFQDLNLLIQEELARVPSSVQESFLAAEKLYKLRIPSPENVPTPTPAQKGLERLDALVEKEKKQEAAKDKKERKAKTPAQVEKNKQKLAKLREKTAAKKKAAKEAKLLNTTHPQHLPQDPLPEEQEVETASKKRKQDDFFNLSAIN